MTFPVGVYASHIPAVPRHRLTEATNERRTVGKAAIRIIAPEILCYSVIISTILLGVCLSSSTASARPMEEFCTRISNYAGTVAGEPYLAAISALADALSDNRPTGGMTDTVLDTVIATDVVQRGYQKPYRSVAGVAEDIRARCLNGPDPESALSRTGQAQSSPVARKTEIGFSCPSPHDSLAQRICDYPDLSRLHKIYIQDYQALRHQAGLPGEPALRREAVNFGVATRRQCGIPMPGLPTVTSLPDTAAQCVRQAYQKQQAILAARLVAPAAEEPDHSIVGDIALQTEPSADQTHRLPISSGVGRTVSEIRTAYPAVNCSEEMCDFGRDPTPERLCPNARPCDNLALFISGGQVVGFVADFSPRDWTQSLNESIAEMGPPGRKTVVPSGRMTLHIDSWTWSMSGRLALTYTATTGTNNLGAALDDHSIMLSPNSSR